MQALIFTCFLQDRHFNVALSFIGESEIRITLLGATYYIASTGRPSETVKVENKNFNSAHKTNKYGPSDHHDEYNNLRHGQQIQ